MEVTDVLRDQLIGRLTNRIGALTARVDFLELCGDELEHSLEAALAELAQMRSEPVTPDED